MDNFAFRRRRAKSAGRDIIEGAPASAAGGTYHGAVLDWWKIGAEVSVVLPLRLLRLAALGNGAREEARLMVAEKVEAHVLLAHRVASGAIGRTAGEVSHGVARHYLGYVRANRRRLLAKLRTARKD